MLKQIRYTTALMMSVMFAGIAPAQKMRGHAKAAVVEFSPGANVSGMTHESKRHLQASIANWIVQKEKFDVVDTRHTREASQGILAEVNNESSTSAAVKVGKQLGTAYVLTGTVAEYNPKGGEGFGSATLRVRLVEVATGRVKYSGEIAQKGTRKMYGTGVEEMHSNVFKPAVVRLVAELDAKQ
jgi:curli biogenesis system outer membrane secretion channel CsgG